MERSFLKPRSQWPQKQLSALLNSNIMAINSNVLSDNVKDTMRRFRKDAPDHNPFTLMPRQKASS